MKNWIVKIEIDGLLGREVKILEIKARNIRSVRTKVYNKMGNRSFSVIDLREKEA